MDRDVSAEADDLKKRLRGRVELERLFGIEEVYVGKRRAAGAKAGAKPKPKPKAKPKPKQEPRQIVQAPAPAPAADAKRPAADEAREATVAAARERIKKRSERAVAEPVAASAPVEEEFLIEDMPGSAESGLMSDAEREGIPHVSGEEGTKAERLARLAAVVEKCTRCGLSQTRNHVVFGEANPDAKIVFVGEAPGADEDASGRPFVGRAGKLLTKIIEAMGLTREDVFICNVLKCRPPNNRTPAPDEVLHCSPFLHEQLGVIQPDVICALGGPASKTLLGTKEGITRLRGRLFRYRGIPLMPTFHPAYLLRNAREKRTVWEDMKKLLRFMARQKDAT